MLGEGLEERGGEKKELEEGQVTEGPPEKGGGNDRGNADKTGDRQKERIQVERSIERFVHLGPTTRVKDRISGFRNKENSG